MRDTPEDVAIETGGALAAPSVQQVRYKGIAVCGSHPATVRTAPFADRGWLVYACSPDNSPCGPGKHAAALPRVDQWFEVHAPIEHHSRPFGYLQFVSQLPFVWLRDERALPHFRGGRLYPDEALRGRKIVHANGAVEFTPGRFHRSQFKSSIAFMMAKAIVDIEEMVAKGMMGGDGNPPMLGLWGILQAGKQEYQLQRSSTQYFLEECFRAGIRTLVAPESGLFHDDPEEF